MIHLFFKYGFTNYSRIYTRRTPNIKCRKPISIYDEHLLWKLDILQRLQSTSNSYPHLHRPPPQPPPPLPANTLSVHLENVPHSSYIKTGPKKSFLLADPSAPRCCYLSRIKTAIFNQSINQFNHLNSILISGNYKLM